LGGRYRELTGPTALLMIRATALPTIGATALNFVIAAAGHVCNMRTRLRLFGPFRHFLPGFDQAFEILKEHITFAWLLLARIDTEEDGGNFRPDEVKGIGREWLAEIAKRGFEALRRILQRFCQFAVHGSVLASNLAAVTARRQLHPLFSNGNKLAGRIHILLP